jgi:hypothetical protein
MLSMLLLKMEQNLWNKFSESDLHKTMQSRLEAQSHWKRYRVGEQCARTLAEVADVNSPVPTMISPVPPSKLLQLQ